jgi:hypothetical protein
VHLFGNHAMTHERRVCGFVLLKLTPSAS